MEEKKLMTDEQLEAGLDIMEKALIKCMNA